MFCSKCGNLVDDHMAFCPHCGAKVEESTQTVEAVDLPAQEPEAATETAEVSELPKDGSGPKMAEEPLDAERTAPVGKHDVFISYSTKNKNVADAIVADFEQHGIKCWYAPRDILPGQEWVSAIKEGLNAAKVLVLIYTDESNNSKQVMNEVALAFNAGKTIVPFRLTEGEMNDELEYYLTRVHWLDAVSKPLNRNIDELRQYIEVIIRSPQAGTTELQQEVKNNKKKRKRKKWLIGGGVAAILLLLIAMCSSGGSTEAELMEQGLAAFHSQYHGAEDNAQAKNYFEQAAAKGSADAYYYLGRLDERVYDYESAQAHYEEGMEKGSDLSRLRLGDLYRTGLSGRTDLEKARELFYEAQENGCVEANYYIGILTKNGLIEGEDADAQRAIDYFEQAQKSNDPSIVADATEEIGKIYKEGSAGVETDVTKALQCYEEAITSYAYEEGDGNNLIGNLYTAQGEEVRADEYYQKALAFYEKSAEAGNIRAMNSAGRSDPFLIFF